MKKIKNNRGITLVSLAVTIVIMLILTISINANLTTTTEIKKYNNIKEDIIALTEEVKIYYLKNGKLPIYENNFISQLPLTTQELKRDVNPNDEGNYFYINTNELPDISLNCGEGNKTKNFNSKDIYVINEKSFTVYYLNGAILNGEKHYTIVDDFNGGSFAEDYYNKVNLPLISLVALEGSGPDKTIVTTGDRITLKILANYEFTKKPIVKINNENVEVIWNGTIGEAIYDIPNDIDTLNNNDEITFSISDYEVGNRIGKEITSTTFGEKVIFNKF